MATGLTRLGSRPLGLLTTQAGHEVACGTGVEHDLASELTGAAGDQHAHQRLRMLVTSGCHQWGWSTYQPTVASRATSNSRVGVAPSAVSFAVSTA